MGNPTRRSADPDLELPKFLRVTPNEEAKRRAHWDKMIKEGKVTTVTSEKPATVMLTPLVRLAENAAEEAGFSIRKGVVPRRWADDKKMVAELHAHLEEAHQKAAESLRRFRESQADKPKPYEGMIALKVLLGQMKPPVKRRHAIRAIEEAKLIHKKYHFQREEAELVKNTIRKWTPPPKTQRRSVSVDLDRGKTIRYTAKENPKKPGSSAHARWEKLIGFSGKTVGEYLDDKGNPTTLLNAVSMQKVELTDGVDQADKQKVPRKDGGRVRGEAKKAASVAPGKRDGRADARRKRR